jgi:23S rRNA pseudouridine2605 synthase
VTVNGQPAHLGESADPGRDEIAVDGERVRPEPLAYWLLHKPAGVVTTRRDPEGRSTVLDLLPPAASRLRLYPVGRLDRDSEGLVLLTNDGELAHRVLHPSWGSEKEYRVTVRGRLDQDTARRLQRGVRLSDGATAPATVAAARWDARGETTTFRLVLREGRNRQIRRMLQHLGLPVRRLVRIRIGPLLLHGLARGRARPLDAAELRRLRDHTVRLSASGRRRAGSRSAAHRRTSQGPRVASGRKPKGGSDLAAGKKRKPTSGSAAPGRPGAASGGAARRVRKSGAKAPKTPRNRD